MPNRDVVKLMFSRIWRASCINVAGILLAVISCFAVTLSAAPASTSTAAAGNFQTVPKLQKRVTDLTGSLAPADEAKIESRLKDFGAKKGAQIAVLLVDTTQPEPVFDYAARVFSEWKLGRKGIDDGVLFVVAKGDRKMQILTGPGISGVMTDAVSKRIIAEIVSPKFRSGDFAGGIDDGVAKIISVIDGEALPPPDKRVATKSTGGYENFFVFAIFAAMIVGPMLRAVLGRFLGATATGGLTGAAAWFIAGGLAIPIVSGVLVFLGVLLVGSGLGLGGSGRGGWLSGGGFSGGGSSGGGGFSGGGGSFDGGGASGDW